MIEIKNQSFDEERALYGSEEIAVVDCAFDGPADGESAFKESCNVRAKDCFFNLRYPFWHVNKLEIAGSEMTELCRAALWYSSDITISDTKLHGIKALRECEGVRIQDSDIVSPEFGWSTNNIEMVNTSGVGEYFMMRSEHLRFSGVKLNGKYSFQYIKDAVFEDCTFDTKDAFWHAKDVVVRNCTLKGEYLAWYCENVTFENCRIIGTQPLCYCKGLKLIDCEMEDTDLSFEKSEVEATITTPVVSIKNPAAGTIRVPSVGQIIQDDPDSKGTIIIQQNTQESECAQPHQRPVARFPKRGTNARSLSGACAFESCWGRDVRQQNLTTA